MGQKVIATARNIERIRDIEQAGASAMTVDVTWSPEKLKEATENAIKIYGAIEEVSHQETYDLFNANVFGVLNVTRSFLPHFRDRRSGSVVIISSVSSRQSYPGAAMYGVTKAAVSKIGEELKDEVEPLGIKVLTIDLGHARTPVLKTNLKRAAQVIPDYTSVNEWFDDFRGRTTGNEPNDPKLGVLRIIEAITQSGMAADRKVPARIILGADGKEPLVKRCQDTLEQIEEWSDYFVGSKVATSIALAA
ncbi:short-chain dehydrogenases reductases (SDR) family, partial [Rhizoctonia solani]